MTNDTRTALIDSLTATPRQTAVELGITIAEAKAMEAEGIIVSFGTRVTGKRGRPPIEWVVAGTEVSDTQQEAVEAAQHRVALVLNYDRICNRMWRLREAFSGLFTGNVAGIPEDAVAEYAALADEKALIYEATGGKAPQASTNDFVLAGEYIEPDEAFVTDAVLVAA
jgi:hypothetical protein